jgi:Transposase IS66 family
MPKKLSDAEIKLRLQEGRNYKRLYFELKDKYDALLVQNQQQAAQIDALTARFEAIVEAQAARITELETMVFGRKPKPRSGGKPPSSGSRSSASYRRASPSESEVTGETHHDISDCHHCGGPLTDMQVYNRYIEDIILAALTPEAQFRTIIHETIQRGWCAKCSKYSSAKDLRGQDVSLGSQVRSLVIYLVTLRDHSYDQVIRILWDLYRFKMSDGEITAIMDERRLEYLPVYEGLKDTIRAGPGVHLDESRWPIQSEAGAGYAWSMSAISGPDVVFKLADSRGKGNAEELVGKDYKGIGITDRYPGYKTLFVYGCHQICWAHLQRTAKDLTHLECLTTAKQLHVNTYYQQLAVIYADIRAFRDEPFDEATRKQQAAALLKRVKTLCVPSDLDPKKLANLKVGILEYQDCLFLCLTVRGIPADNNRAERDIRKLVMKRRKSLGVKTPKGARTLEVLLSVCWSLYNRDRDNFFPALQALGATR